MDDRGDRPGSASAAIDYSAVRARALDASLAPGRVLLVGESPTAKDLLAAASGRFVRDGAAPDGEVGDVLALSLEPDVLQRARAAAAERGCSTVCALVEPAARANEPVGAARAALGSSGLVLVGVRRIFWQVTWEPATRSRAQRIREETRELLVRAAAAESEQSSRLLEEELTRLERELSIASELRMEQQTARAVVERRLAESLVRHDELVADRERLRADVTRLQGQVSQLGEQLGEARREIDDLRQRSSLRARIRRMRPR